MVVAAFRHARVCDIEEDVARCVPDETGRRRWESSADAAVDKRRRALLVLLLELRPDHFVAGQFVPVVLVVGHPFLLVVLNAIVSERVFMTTLLLARRLLSRLPNLQYSTPTIFSIGLFFWRCVFAGRLK